MIPDQARSGASAWLRPPQLSDPHLARVAATVHTLSVAFVLASIGWAIAAAFILPQPQYVVPTSLGMTVVCVAAYVLAHLERPKTAALLLISGLWLFTTLAAGLSGGVEAPGMSVYLVLIIAAGLLIDVRSAVVVAACSAGATFAFAFLHESELLEPVIETSLWSEVGVELTLIVAAAGLLWDALGRINLAMELTERSEAKARAVFDQASDGIVIMDRDGRLLEANARAAEISGYSQEEMAGLNLRDFMVEDDPEDAEGLFRQMEPGVKYARERVLKVRDGTRIIVENSASLLDDGRIQTIVRDVSERRREQEMNERLRTALDAAQEGVVLFDTTPGLVYANPAFERLNPAEGTVEPGLGPGAVAGGGESRDFIVRAQADLAAGKSYSDRFERFLPDGSRVVRHATITHVHDGAGELVGYVGVLRDVTREVELEESLQLTRKLETVGKLAGGLAHDFNNLLTVILGRAEALRATSPSEDVDEILEAGQRAAAITTKLLAFSRDQAVHSKRVDLNEVVRDAAGMLRRLVRESVRVELDLVDRPVWVEADPSQVQQVLVNLAANSRDAMPGGGTLDVATRLTDPVDGERPADPDLAEGPLVMLSVHDAGEGMDAEVLERLFEPFFTTKDPGHGTGLGLASVREIVRQSGGAIDIQSSLGEGTLVRVFWPLAEALQEVPEPRPAPAPRVRTRTARILVVEDEATLRRLVHRALTSRGHQIVTAHDGPEALQLGLADPPDLVVTDVILPGLDGPALTERLREDHPSLPVLLTSGYAPEDMAGQVEEDERTMFLPKPFTLDQLLGAVDRLLDREQKDLA